MSSALATSTCPGVRLPAAPTDQLAHRRGRGEIQVGGDHLAAVGGEAQRGRPPDPVPRPGDDHKMIAERPARPAM
jgi:hypothetical protein